LPPTSTVCPSTTLFRSERHRHPCHRRMPSLNPRRLPTSEPACPSRTSAGAARGLWRKTRVQIWKGETSMAKTSPGEFIRQVRARSEEHTSELQSRENLV